MFLYVRAYHQCPQYHVRKGFCPLARFFYKTISNHFEQQEMHFGSVRNKRYVVLRVNKCIVKFNLPQSVMLSVIS